jgi:hypothetical protein
MNFIICVAELYLYVTEFLKLGHISSFLVVFLSVGANYWLRGRFPIWWASLLDNEATFFPLVLHFGLKIFNRVPISPCWASYSIAGHIS